MEAAIRETLIESLKLSPIKIMAAAIYGSWARGAQTKNSDVDILIISNEVNPKRQRRGKEISLFKESLYIGQPVDVLLLTETECVSNFRNHNPLFLDIAWEGIILIDNNDFLKNLIEETLLYVNNKKIEKLVEASRKNWAIKYQKIIKKVVSDSSEEAEKEVKKEEQVVIGANGLPIKSSTYA